MGGLCGTHCILENYILSFLYKNLKGRIHLEGIRLNRLVILKFISNKCNMRVLCEYLDQDGDPWRSKVPRRRIFEFRVLQGMF